MVKIPALYDTIFSYTQYQHPSSFREILILRQHGFGKLHYACLAREIQLVLLHGRWWDLGGMQDSRVESSNPMPLTLELHTLELPLVSKEEVTEVSYRKLQPQ